MNVPEKKRKKTIGVNNSDRSSSPNSPMELRMNCSGDFSDFISSGDEKRSCSGSRSGSAKLKNSKLKAQNNYNNKKIQNQSNSNNGKLPDIEENKSI